LLHPSYPAEIEEWSHGLPLSEPGNPLTASQGPDLKESEQLKNSLSLPTTNPDLFTLSEADGDTTTQVDE
jgi:hypothetical protein